MKICSGYCGITCVNGYCPNANMDVGRYIECEDCFYYQGCEDCVFADTENCIKSESASGSDKPPRPTACDIPSS